MKKININKSDEAALIVEKIIETEEGEVILIIPRFSYLAESLENFHLLKRESEAMGKKLLIESVDNRVIELAEMAGIEALNPFFVKNKKQFSDIVPKKEKSSSIKSGSSLGVKKSKDDDWQKEKEFLETLSEGKYSHRGEVFHGAEEEKISWTEKFPLKAVILLIVAGFVVYGAAVILPRADLKIVAKKTNWTYNDSVITQTSSKSDSKTITIPNQKFSLSKNGSLPFSATGKKQVSKSAVGKMTVYNGYSSDSQILVKNTRFLSPDGKIFLLVKQITVPGAKISEGKIIPSSIETDVIAEKAGEDYNIAPTKLFSIPGFKGTPKYNAFYGESKDSMSGGFVGEIAYPTTADISVAKLKINDTFQSYLKTTLGTQISSDFAIIEGASSFSILKQTVNEEVDKDGNFSIFSDTKMDIIAFKESDLIDVLKQRAESDNQGLYFVKSYDLSYGIARMNVVSGQLSFPVTFNAVLSYKIDVDALRKEVAGKSDVEFKKVIFSLPGLDTANVSLWPFWVKTVPTNANKINIAID